MEKQKIVKVFKRILLKLGGRKVTKLVQCIYKIFYQVLREANYILYYLQPKFILKRFGSKITYKYQKNLIWNIDAKVKNYKELKKYFDSNDIYYKEGGHTIYVPPQVSFNSIFKKVVNFYPQDSGFKIIKNIGKVEEATYHNKAIYRTWGQSKLLGKSKENLGAYNYLYLKNIGTNIYDFAELNFNNSIFPCFIVQHIEGVEPTQSEGEKFKGYLDSVFRDEELVYVHPKWKNHKDFQGKTCNANLIKSNKDGQLYYVDFQNFILLHSGNIINKKYKQLKQASHFGDRHIARGGKYLYQSIDELNKYGKRNIAYRWETIKTLIAGVDFDFNNSIVLDVGCNIGMFIARSLQEGALWAFGWDFEKVTKYSEQMLKLLGYTRFNLFGVDLGDDYKILHNIPSRFNLQNNKIVIFYLAMRRHIGFLSDLGRISWDIMIYEGHQKENLSGLSKLSDLCNFNILKSTTYKDGESTERPLAILAKKII